MPSKQVRSFRASGMSKAGHPADQNTTYPTNENDDPLEKIPVEAFDQPVIPSSRQGFDNVDLTAVNRKAK